MTAERIEAFWSVACHQTRTAAVLADPGTSAEESLVPPAWAFGATPTEADDLIALVIGGTKTATAGALWDFEHEDEDLPRVGDLVILLDGSQRPRVLVEVTQVEVVPFDEVGEEHARLEAEGDLSLAHWRDVHERFFVGVATHGRGFVETMPVVLQRFQVLYAQSQPVSQASRLTALAVPG